ncbi:DUF3696 domain-containing protein [bacterium]|nr:DUF3696 domain-containing protein [bacterium]
MLHSLRLENFKAFRGPVDIELAPITLLFGANSSGKSSILQALQVLKQTRDHSPYESTLLPRIDNGIIDLGSFSDFVFDHDARQAVSIGLEVDPWSSGYEDGDPDSLDAEPTRSPVMLSLEFVRPTPDQSIHIEAFEVSISRGRIARFEQADLSQHILGGEFECTWVTDDPSLWSATWKRAKQSEGRARPDNTAIALDECERKIGKLSIDFFFDPEVSTVLQNHGVTPDRVESFAMELAERCESFRKFRASDPSLSEYRARMIEAALRMRPSLEGFLPTRVDSADPWQVEDQWGLDAVGTAYSAGKSVIDLLSRYVPISSLRVAPQRWYAHRGITPKHVDLSGALLPDLLFRRPELLEQTNAWLKRMDVGYSLHVDKIGRDSSDLFEIRLRDLRRAKGVDVGLTDVGFGVSQLLPIVVQCVAGVEQLVSIEQPEVHVHPRLQAEIGDLIFDASRGDRCNQFIVETHSEHLVLRLQRKVREGKLPPDDLAILYVERGDNGSTVKRLHLDEEGEFIDEWPGGFFPERLRELFSEPP